MEWGEGVNKIIKCFMTYEYYSAPNLAKSPADSYIFFILEGACLLTFMSEDLFCLEFWFIVNLLNCTYKKSG